MVRSEDTGVILSLLAPVRKAKASDGKVAHLIFSNVPVEPESGGIL